MKKLLISILSLLFSFFLSAQPADLVLTAYNNETTIRAANSITLKSGVHIPSGKNVLITVGGYPSIVSIPSSGQNYILTRTFRDTIKLAQLGNQRTIGQENQSIQYFDGLGRPSQAIQLMASPTYKDIVQHIEYDGFGRESTKYLPYGEKSGNGSFRTGAKTTQSDFYKDGIGWDAAVVKTPSPYSVTVFENSPLNRVVEQGAPGASWQPATTRGTAGRTVVTEYGTNGTNDVRLWTINSTDNGATSGYYQPGRLYKTIVKDENWVAANGKAGIVEEYRDFEDHVVLKRVWETDSKKLETHYVYDDFGDLRYVVPPGYTTTTITDNNVDFNELLYAYRYDGWRRLIEKKVPGKGWEYLVYNKNDQVVLTQDAVQRGQNKWSYTKYDAFGKVVESGLYSNTKLTTRKTAQDSVEAHKTPGASVQYYWEERTGAANYSNRSFPTSSGKTVLLTNYYDDYAFKTASVLPATGGLDSTRMVKGLLTGTKISKDDGTSPLLSVNYYDMYGRVIETVSDNHLGGVDRITNTYNFSGDLVTSKHQHRISGSTAVTTIITSNEYDHVGRLVQTKKKVGSQTEVIQSKLAYNEIGQLKEKKLHSENSGTNFLTSIAYQYNERGWQTKSSSPQFTSQLKYIDGTVPQYNGNIAQQLWGYGATTSSTFNYSYDALNRLKNGSSTGTVMSEALTYDDMGNIRTLVRDGGTTISYAYNNSNRSNRLASLSGGLTGTFTYDLNGNATKDRTGMALTYNYLNLPKTANRTGTSVSYLYDAMGTKLNRKSTVGTITTEQDYIGGIEYSSTGTSGKVIERIATDEGFLLNSSGTYSYHYNLTDHLGNVRAVLKKGSSATVPEIVQKQDYYPFGKTKSIATSVNNKYLYNGKEMQAELNGGTHTLGSSYVLEGQLDYGARFYDAEIGRWNVVDPLAEKAYNWSPYRYGYNNPMKFTDPTGMLEDWVSMNGEVFYDSRVVDQATANEFYGSGATYRAVGFKYTSSSGNQVELGDHGFFRSNGEVFNSPDLGESAIMSGPVDNSGKIMKAGLAISAGLLADDITGIGVADDIAIPGVLLAAGAGSILGKMSFELDKIRARQNTGPQGFQYALLVNAAGDYPIFSRGSSSSTGNMHLNKGDVWKYGETTSSDRYSQDYLDGIGAGGVNIQPQFYGNQMQIKVAEKVKIYNYFLTNGHLPPGNKIFR